MDRTVNSKRQVSARIIFLQDMFLSLLASLLSVLLVRWVSEPIPGFTFLVLKWLGVSAAGTLAGLLLSQSYKDVHRFATVRSMGKTIFMVLIKESFLVAILVFGVIRMSAAHSVLAILSDFIMTGAVLAYLRLSARLLLKTKTDVRTSAQSRSALVYGTNDDAVALAEELEREGYSIAGFLTREPEMAGRVILDHVVYLYSSEQDLSRLQWQLGGIDGIFFPKSADFSSHEGSSMDETPQKDGMSLLGHAVKRSFDIGLSSLLLLVFSPVIAVCALLVRREDGGPAIYAQERVGRGGVPFKIYKFRSMRMDAEAQGSPALYSGEDDPRLTSIGRFLRAHHLDELPQLWNVLRGDMSFIGYRPERQYYIDRIMACNARYRYLYQIRPGVTSYATLYNGYTDSLDKMLTRLDLDLYYLRNHSVWFDIKVLGLTFLSIISGKKF